MRGGNLFRDLLFLLINALSPDFFFTVLHMWSGP